MKEYDKFITGINSKDRIFWKELYSNYYAALCNYSSKIINDRDASEDIVQNILVSLWDSSMIFNDISGLTSFLYKSVYNRSLNFIRDAKNKVNANLDTTHSTENLESYYISLAIEEEVINKFYKALDSMSSQQKNVIILTLKGESIESISNLLSISINTVKTHKKRAYNYIKDQLGDSFFILNILIFLK